MPRLDQIDVNLLVALDVLLEERHVTRAAQRLAVTQSAMSQTLKRLRSTFDDPLLVRSGGTMVPTPRAQAIRSPLRSALQSLQGALELTPRFDPATEQRRFRLACIDAHTMSLVPPIVHAMACAGPGLALAVAPGVPERLFSDLREGEVDVGVLGLPSHPTDIGAEPLFEDRVVTMVREGHPLLEDPSLENFVAWPHVVFQVSGRGTHLIDRLLAPHGYQRRVVGAVSSFLAAPSLVANSDCITSVPLTCAVGFQDRWPVAFVEPPFPPIRYTMNLYWSRHLDADGANRWLREQVIEQARVLDEAMASVSLGM